MQIKPAHKPHPLGKGRGLLVHSHTFSHSDLIDAQVLPVAISLSDL
jgi:hypothetical protein